MWIPATAAVTEKCREALGGAGMAEHILLADEYFPFGRCFGYVLRLVVV
jgi:hypothetical protein